MTIIVYGLDAAFVWVAFLRWRLSRQIARRGMRSRRTYYRSTDYGTTWEKITP